jgi:hypothetical protein
MANLSASRVTLAGVAPAFVAASAGGDVVAPNNGVLVVKNDDVAAVTVTIATPGKTEFGLDQPDVTVSVPAGSTRYIGPLSPRLNDVDLGGVPVSYSSVTSLSVAVLVV